MEQRRTQRHLLAAWNPAFAADAMEAHLSVLLKMVEEFRRGERDEEQVYVWWAKMRSPNRTHPLPHLADILSIDRECDPERHPEREVHLYLTDYRSLYVAQLAEVSMEDMREQGAEHAHMPGYYLRNAGQVDCWFRLFDIRRIVGDDTLWVIEELEKLRNVRHHARPVSLYGGMVDLPLIVTRPDGARYFDDDERLLLADGKFWAEFDAERVGLGVIERELRENMFGEWVWRALKPTARSFLATAEKIFRDHRSDPAFDFTPVVIEFSKAFEVQCNAILRTALGMEPKERRLANVEGKVVDVAKHGALSLCQLAVVIENESGIRQRLRRLNHGSWFTEQLPRILRSLADIRNPAAHVDRVGREEALRLRDRVVGVGCPGDILELANVRPASV